MSLLVELRRRKVFRVAAAYAVASWGVAQIADLVLANTAAPPWVMQVTLLMLALGFPIALVLAWAFEVTPDGVKRTATAAPGERASGLPASEYAFIALMVGVIVVAGYQVFTLHDRSGPTAETAEAGSAEPGVAPTEAAGATSIAVLPFVNMSMDAGNEYFADGISEELLNILAGIDGLKVASRTSAFSFKNSSTPIPEIAERLDVRHVLEGSVRKAGNRVRITAQLIDASNDAHLWSEVYDRELDDIFAVQEEIAQAITVELEGLLGTRRIAVTAPTQNMDAYQLYLRGRSRFYGRSELNEAVEDLRATVDQDPEFAEAWAFLAALYWLHGNGGYQSDYDRAEMTRLSALASERASELDADIPIALAVQGQIMADSGESDAVARGIRLLENAVARSTVDTTPMLWLSLLWIELGHAERALPLMERARSLDPLVGINAGVESVAHAIEGRFDRAEQFALESDELDGLTFWGDMLALHFVHDGQQDEAVRLIEELLARLGDEYEEERTTEEAILRGLKDPSSWESLFDSGAWTWARSDLLVASLMFDRGRRAFEQVPNNPNRAWAILIAAWLPSMHWLREDPRYFELMRRTGRVAYWDAHGYPRGCRPVDVPDGRHLDCPETTP